MSKKVDDVFKALSDHLAAGAHAALALGKAHRAGHVQTGHAFHGDAASASDDLSKSMEQASQACMECAKAVADSLDDTLGKTIQPIGGLSTVVRRDTDPEPFGIRKVIRPGQPTESLSAADIENIDPAFRHLVGGE